LLFRLRLRRRETPRRARTVYIDSLGFDDRNLRWAALFGSEGDEAPRIASGSGGRWVVDLARESAETVGGLPTQVSV
jgi:hypothetical protein